MLASPVASHSGAFITSFDNNAAVIIEKKKLHLKRINRMFKIPVKNKIIHL